MIKTLNVLFYLRKDKIDKNGDAPIYCRITYNKERVDFTIKRIIPAERWDASKGKVKGSNPESKAINKYIDMLRNKINKHCDSLEERGKSISAKILVAFVSDKPNNPNQNTSLFKLFELHNRKVKSLIGHDFAKGTWERFETCYKHLKQFVKLEYNTIDYPISGVDNNFVTEFEYFLRTVRKCENNSAVKYMRNFRKIIRIALEDELLEKDPFKNYKGKVIDLDRYYLTEQELETLLNKNISIGRVELVKDIFLFSCYTGLAYVDVAKLKPDNLKRGIDDKLWLFTKRTKTKVVANIPLLPVALKIIEKYKNHPDSISKGTLLPVSTNQKTNAYLKEIADICGINKVLTFHIARHTFATTVTLANGVPIESVSKMLGHKSIKTTQHYAKVVDRKVGDDMQSLLIKLKKENLKN